MSGGEIAVCLHDMYIHCININIRAHILCRMNVIRLQIKHSFRHLTCPKNTTNSEDH